MARFRGPRGQFSMNQLYLFKVFFCILVKGFKRRRGYCQGDDISTGTVMTLSQCSNACLRSSSYAAFLFNGVRCKLLTNTCKQTRLDNTNIYMYDQCKYIVFHWKLSILDLVPQGSQSCKLYFDI